MKINVKNAAISAGLLWGAGLAGLTVLALLIPNYAETFLRVFEETYIGYTVSWVGVIVGFIWAFFDAAIGATIFSLIYNKLGKK